MGRIFGPREEPLEGSGLVMAVRLSEEWYRLHKPPLRAAFEDKNIALIRHADHAGDPRQVKVIRRIAGVPLGGGPRRADGRGGRHS